MEKSPQNEIDESEIHFQKLARFVLNGRVKENLLDAEGKLDLKRKLAGSNYEVLTREYYLKNLTEQQGIPEPRYKTGEELREAFVMYTQEIVNDIKKAKEKPDVLFFLDKSARPVAWMLKKLWPLFAPEEKLPVIKFLNIDANQILKLEPAGRRPDPEQIYNWQPTQKQIEEMQKNYIHDGKTLPESPQSFNKAWIIDEVSVPGGTKDISRKLLEGAFPNLDVQTKSWMPAGMKRIGRRGYEEEVPSQLAPWYSHYFSQGRGIGEPGTNQFLSSGREKDILTEALRTDITLLAQDIKEGKQAVRPIVGCYEINPETKMEDKTRPKYKLALYAYGGERTIITPAKAETE